MDVDLKPISRDIGERKFAFLLFASVIVAGTAVAYYLYSEDRYALTYYGDAASHLVAARKLFDWAENPGWSQIGTVWLPLPHVLLMLPSFIDGLFFTGFSGVIVSLPSMGLTSVLFYKIVMRMLRRMLIVEPRMARISATSTALLYGLNPNFVYLGITAMTEAVFMLFFVLSLHFLIRWNYPDGNHAGRNALKYLLLSSACAIAATLCRYEGWILSLFVAVYPIIVTIIRKNRKPGNTFEKSRSRTHTPLLRAAAMTALASIFSLSGIVFWFAYNAVTYGDPLEFANAQYYSAASQAINRSFREDLYLQPANVLTVYGITTLLTYGPIILSASVVGGYVVSRVGRGGESWRSVWIFLLLPPAFTLVTLLVGIGEMAYWFNSRFVILLSPFLMLLTGFYVAALPRRIISRRSLLYGVVGGLFVFYLAVLPFGAVVTLADAKGGFFHKHSPFAVLTGENIASLYDGTGSIMTLTGSAQEHRIMLASGIAFSHFDSIIESSTWKSSFSEPWNNDVKWIILSNDPDSDGTSVAKYWDDRRTTLEQYYQTVYRNEYYEILQLR